MAGRDHRAQRIVPHIADIVILRRLHPGPAILAVVNRDLFAEQKFARLACGFRRAGAQRGAARKHARRVTFHIAFGRNQPAQMRRRQIATCWRQPRIGICVGICARRTHP